MKTIFGFVIVVLLGTGIWLGMGIYQSASEVEDIADDSVLEHTLKHLDPEYVCPMHPSVVSDKPGSCPICGMDLEQRKVDAQQDSGVMVSAAMQRSLGVVTAMVEYGHVSEEVYAAGEVSQVVSARSTVLEASASGEVHKIFVKSDDWVVEKSPIALIDSPEYSKLRKAFLLAHKQRKRSKVSEYAGELAKFGVPSHVLRLPFNRGPPSVPEFIEVIAAQSGRVAEFRVSEGEAIEVGAPLVEITAPELTNAEYRVYSSRARGMKVGNSARLEIVGLPGRGWPGRIIRVIHSSSNFYATLVTVQYEMPNEVVATGSFVGGLIEAGVNGNVLRVPTSAIIYGDQSTRVVRKHEDGYFLVLDVELGFEGANWTEIVSGLKEGGRVVTRGQFMIDSEASMRAGLERLKDGDEDL